jgi:UDP-glucose 4-epimerase
VSPGSHLPQAKFRAGDVPDLTADPAASEEELGFKAEKGLEEMCADLWNFQTKHPNGYDA